jgi:hypothetical protein
VDLVDLALLSRVNHAAREAVKGSGRPRMGGSADEPRVAIHQFCDDSLSLFVWVVAHSRCEREKTTTCSAAAQVGGAVQVESVDP